MISILIPIYNFDVTRLVSDLHQQAETLQVAFEIRCYDDGSSEAFKAKNREVRQLPHVQYEEMPENMGRSKIRNRLAEDAEYPQLLFMDCDSQVEDDQYLARYIKHAFDYGLVYGGRSYAPAPPEEPELYLRWYYGVEREVIAPEKRQQKPYNSFMTNNFLTPKKIFLTIRLNESLKGYGHEDTLFGIALQAKQIPIKHIDNPLRHIGLENSEEFLRKTKEGLKNLHLLIQQGQMDKNVKIYRYFRRLKKLGLGKATVRSFQKNEAKIEANLNSASPNLKRFDFYKLAHLIELDLQSKSR